MKTPLLGDKSFYKIAIAVGLPIALQSLLTASGSMVDMFMISNQGELAVSAVSICARYAALMFSAFFGFFNGGTIFFAQFWGVKDEQGISRAYGLTVVCTLFLGLLFGAIAFFAPEWILRIYTDKDDIRQMAVPYLRILGIGLPFQVFAFVLSGLMRSTKQVKIPLYASIAALLTNTSLNWILINGQLGMPALGVRGAAIATVISNVVNVVILFVFGVFDKQRSFLFRFRDHYRWNMPFVKQYFSKSLFIVANEIFMGAGFMIIDVVAFRQDASAIAVLGVFRVIEGIVFSFFRGFSNASSITVGQKIGNGDHLGGYTDAKRYALLCPAVIVVVCILQWIFSEPLLSIFGLSSMAMGYGKQMFLVYIIAATMRTCNWICNDTFRAGGESVFGTVVEIICMVVFTIPAMVLSGIVFQLPFIVVFICMYTDDYVRNWLILRYMNSAKWIKPVTEKGREALPAFHAVLQSGENKKLKDRVS